MSFATNGFHLFTDCINKESTFSDKVYFSLTGRRCLRSDLFLLMNQAIRRVRRLMKQPFLKKKNYEI